jgi:DNA-binding NarL/FixJ family response regulator
MSGLIAAQQIRHKSPRSGVLVLSLHVQESILTAAFAAGVHSYLTKDVSSGDVIDGIRHTTRARR